MSRELAMRSLVAVIGIPVLLFVFYCGGVWLRLMLGMIAVLGMWEWRCMQHEGSRTINLIYVVGAAAVYLVCTEPAGMRMGLFHIPLWVLIILFCLFRALVSWLFETPSRARQDSLAGLGIVYTGVLPALIYNLDSAFRASLVLLMLVVQIWITDSAAYFVGMKWGRHRGIFPVSPKKSLEGFVAGIIAPMVFAVPLYLLHPAIGMTNAFLIAICAGIVGQVGDLAESKIKRLGGVKDSSNIIPGHGGILDRFDSLLLAAPVLYGLITIFS